MATISADAERMLGLLEEALSATERLIEAVEPADWSAPTPCEAMNAHQVVEHLVGGLEQFAEIGSGRPADEVAFEATFAPAEARARYDHAGDHMLAVWSVPGVADRPHVMPWGEVPGVMLLGFMFIEQVGHGWDLAKATGQASPYNPNLVEAALTLGHDYDDPSIRVEGMFAPIVPIAPERDAFDRLAAFQGRDPDAWGRAD